MKLPILALSCSLSLALVGRAPALAANPNPPTLQQSALDMNPEHPEAATPAVANPTAAEPAPASGAPGSTSSPSTTAAAAAEPSTSSAADTLPATASPYDDLAVVGLLTLGGAFVLGRIRRSRG